MKITIQTEAQDGSTEATRTDSVEFTAEEYRDPALNQLILALCRSDQQLQMRITPPPKADK